MTIKTATYQLVNKYAQDEVEEFIKSMVVWAQNQATGQRIQGAISNLKRTRAAHHAKAETYDMMVKYLQGLEIVSA